MLDGFGGEFRSSKTKMDWKHLRIFYPHDSLHHLLPGKGVCVCVFTVTHMEFKIRIKSKLCAN